MTEIATEVIETLKNTPTASLTTELKSRGLINIYLRGPKAIANEGAPMVGEAFTLRYIPMREDLATSDVLGDPEYPQRKAIEAAPPGSVLVMDCRGVSDTGVLGDILATRLSVRGVAGVVADGCVRDIDELSGMNLPIFCLGGSAPSSLTSHFAVDLETPIACGGVAILPGDIIVGDGDGVVVIPRNLAAEIASSALHREKLEGFVKSRIAAGAALPGNYPPNEETLAEFEQSKKN